MKKESNFPYIDSDFFHIDKQFPWEHLLKTPTFHTGLFPLLHVIISTFGRSLSDLSILCIWIFGSFAKHCLNYKSIIITYITSGGQVSPLRASSFIRYYSLFLLFHIEFGNNWWSKSLVKPEIFSIWETLNSWS